MVFNIPAANPSRGHLGKGPAGDGGVATPDGSGLIQTEGARIRRGGNRRRTTMAEVWGPGEGGSEREERRRTRPASP